MAIAIQYPVRYGAGNTHCTEHQSQHENNRNRDLFHYDLLID
jgi:hypothetical protein